MCCNPSSNTSTSSSSPPPQFTQAYLDLINQAQGIAQQPLQQYTGDIVAGESPDQQAATQTIQDSQGIANPYINAAAQDISNSTTPITTNAAQIGQQYGTQAVQGSQNVANAIYPQVQANAQSATGIAQQGAGVAGQQAQSGAQLATSGATQNAQLANQYAGTNVYGQLPTYNGAQGISQYESPYTQQVVDSTQAEFNNQNAQQNQGIVSNAISQGAWGGDRAGVAQGIAAGQEQLAQAPTIANLENQGYTNAQQEFNTQQGLQASLGQSQAQLGASTALGAGNLLNTSGIQSGQLTSGTTLQGAQLGANTNLGAGNLMANEGSTLANTAIQSANVAGQLGIAGAGQDMSAQQANDWLSSQAGAGMANLGTEAESTALAGANAQMSAGSLEQGITQEQLNVPYEQFEAQQAYPLQMEQWLSGIETGIGSAAGGTSSTTSPGPSLFQELLGPAATIGGAAIMASDRNVKEDIKAVGKTKDGQTIYRFRYKGSPTYHMGLIAQEVKRKHPGAVHDMGGILGVDYKAATDKAVKRRATGGGISSAVPDVSISFIPTGGITGGGHGGGPPAPPRPGGAGNGMSNPMQGLSGLMGMQKMANSNSMSMPNTGFADPSSMDIPANTDFEDTLASDMAGMRRGGGIAPMMRHRASGGGSGGGISASSSGPMFTASLTSPRGVSIPQLSTAARSEPGIAANLTKNYGNNPNDASGKSTLPSSTYWPSFGATTSNPKSPYYVTPPPPSDSNPFGSFHRGGQIDSYADGGDIDDSVDDDGPTSGIWSEDDSDLGVPSPGAPPFQTHPIEDQPDGAALPAPDQPMTELDDAGGAGIAPSGASRYSTSYQPRTAPTVDAAADRKQALGMALLMGGAGMMSSRSPHGIEALGQGVMAGAQGYMATKNSQQTREEKAAEQADTDAYRKGTLDQNAQKFSDELASTNAKNAAAGKHIENQDTLAAQAQKDKEAHDKAMLEQGQWEFKNDEMGRPIKINKKTGAAEYVKLPGAAQPGGDGATATGDDYLKTLPSTDQAEVKALSEGRMQFPTGFAISKPYWQQRIAQVAAYDPDFDATNYGVRAATRKAFTSGTEAKKATSLNTVMGHIDHLEGAAEALNNGNVKGANSALNFLASETGDPRMTDFNLARNAVADEVANAFRATGSSEGETQRWYNQLSSASSPKQMAQVAKTLMPLLGSRMSALQDQYQRGMGAKAPPLQLLTPANQEILKKYSPTSDAAATNGSPAPKGVDPTAWQHMTPEERKLFQ